MFMILFLQPLAVWLITCIIIAVITAAIVFVFMILSIIALTGALKLGNILVNKIGFMHPLPAIGVGVLLLGQIVQAYG